VNEPELDAGVAYYGGQPKAEDVAKIEAPLMLHYAGLDERINAGIPAYEEALKKAGKTYEIHMYEGANHAFNNDTNAARYDKEASDLAWGRTVAFLKEHIGSPA
jgi:carboxymethylenebutenolidase